MHSPSPPITSLCHVGSIPPPVGGYTDGSRLSAQITGIQPIAALVLNDYVGLAAGEVWRVGVTQQREPDCHQWRRSCLPAGVAITLASLTQYASPLTVNGIEHPCSFILDPALNGRQVLWRASALSSRSDLMWWFHRSRGDTPVDGWRIGLELAVFEA